MRSVTLTEGPRGSCLYGRTLRGSNWHNEHRGGQIFEGSCAWSVYRWGTLMLQHHGPYSSASTNQNPNVCQVWMHSGVIKHRLSEGLWTSQHTGEVTWREVPEVRKGSLERQQRRHKENKHTKPFYFCLDLSAVSCLRVMPSFTRLHMLKLVFCCCCCCFGSCCLLIDLFLITLSLYIVIILHAVHQSN